MGVVTGTVFGTLRATSHAFGLNILAINVVFEAIYQDLAAIVLFEVWNFFGCRVQNSEVYIFNASGTVAAPKQKQMPLTVSGDGPQ